MYQRSESSPPIVLGLAQLLRKRLLVLASVLVGACFVFMGSRWADNQVMHDSIKFTGFLLIVVCIVGRTWCSLYIAGRKDVNLVTFGAYSISRNPLYFFSILGSIGAGAQFGTITSAAIVGGFALLMFSFVVRQEEKSLREVYGKVYDEYCARVPRFLPRFSEWRGVATVEVDPARVARTFIDACVFLLAIPLAALLEYLQETGVIAVLFRLP